MAVQEVLKRNPGRFLLMFVLGFLSGAFGGLGIGAIIPLFAMVSDKAPEELNVVTKVVQGFFSFLHVPFTMVYLVVFIALLFIAKALIQFVAKYVNIRTTAEYEERIRRDLFTKTFRAEWPYLMGQRSGYLERIMVNDVANGTSIILRANDLILLCTSLLVYLSVALSISVRVTLFTIFFGGGLFLAFRPFLAKTRRLAQKTALTEKETTHHIAETLSGAKLVKAFGVEDSIIKKGREYFQTLRETKIRSGFYQYFLGQAYEPVGFVFIVILFVFFRRMPGFDLVSFVAVIYLVEKAFLYMQSIQGNLYTINDAAPYLQAFLDYRLVTEGRREGNDGSEPFSFSRKLAFDKLVFSYGEDRQILSGVSFQVKKGEMVGFVGSSGAGKTTIVDLLLRLFKPSSGKILMDGKPITEINLYDWRKNIRYVSQDIFLLNDTIENNIRFFDENISSDDITRAAKMANIHDFIVPLPEGYKTIVGERGVTLSGGERQRVALARALIRNPQILILDEATSSLDTKSEALVQKAIENLRGKTTVIIIAHRLSTVMNCDKLMVLEGGKIVEQGLPKELLKNVGSSFYKMYNIQNRPNSKMDYENEKNKNDQKK